MKSTDGTKTESSQGKQKPLPYLRERRLLERALKGDEKARTTLILRTLPFAHWKVKERRKRGVCVPYDILLHECVAALIEAIDTCDLSYTSRLANYASVKMGFFMAKGSRLTNEYPVSFRESCRVKHCDTSHFGLWNETGTRPTFWDITENNDLLGREVESGCSGYMPFLKNARTGHLNVYVDPEGSDLIEFIPESREMEASVISSVEASHLRAALKSLPPRLKAIVEKYFGLFGRHPQTLREIAKEMSISHERVRQLRDEALLGLKQSLRVLNVGRT